MTGGAIWRPTWTASTSVPARRCHTFWKPGARSSTCRPPRASAATGAGAGSRSDCFVAQRLSRSDCFVAQRLSRSDCFVAQRLSRSDCFVAQRLSRSDCFVAQRLSRSDCFVAQRLSRSDCFRRAATVAKRLLAWPGDRALHARAGLRLHRLRPRCAGSGRSVPPCQRPLAARGGDPGRQAADRGVRSAARRRGGGRTGHHHHSRRRQPGVGRGQDRRPLRQLHGHRDGRGSGRSAAGPAVRRDRCGDRPGGSGRAARPLRPARGQWPGRRRHRVRPGQPEPLCDVRRAGRPGTARRGLLPAGRARGDPVGVPHPCRPLVHAGRCRRTRRPGGPGHALGDRHRRDPLGQGQDAATSG